MGFEVFDKWSSKGNMYKENEPGYMEKIWNSLTGHSHKGDPVTIGTVINIFNKFPPKVNIIEMPMKEEKKQIPRGSGLYQAIVDEVDAQLPHQKMYGHLAALCILGTMAQRRIYSDKSKPMNFYALATQPNAQKSTLYQMILSVIEEVLPTSAMRHPASAQALQDIFSKEANQFYGSDEAISRMVAIYSDRNGKNTPKGEMYDKMLEYFGNPKKVLGQQNKKKEDSSASATAPRLTWLAIGTDSQWQALLSTPEFIASGMGSRFAPFSGITYSDEVDPWWDETRSNELSPELIEALKKKYGAYVCAADHMPTLQKIELLPECKIAITPFFKAMQERKGEEGISSIWLRMIERAVWYATVHAWADDRVQVTAKDIELGVGICEYHVSLWDGFLGKGQVDEVSECRDCMLRIVGKHPNCRINFIYRMLPIKFRGPKGMPTRSQAISLLIESRMIQKDAKTKLFSLTPEYITSLSKASSDLKLV